MKESKFHILIVDDVGENRFALESLLDEEIENLMIYQASNGHEALDIVLGKPIELIILDIQMPGMNGFEVARLLKSKKNTSDIPIVFLTAVFKSEAFQQEGFDIGAIDYMTKPIDEHQMINKIKLYLQVYKKEKELEKLNNELESINLTLEERVINEVKKNRQKDKMLEIQSRHAEMGEMIGAIAHQWLQPLNTIGLYVQNLNMKYKRDLVNEEIMNSFQKNMMKQIKHMSDTMNDFRNFFKPTQKSKFSVKASIKDVIYLIEKQYITNDIIIHIDCSSDSKICGYENEFKQVILNIFNNAKDAMIEREIEDRKIVVKIFKEGHREIILIRDKAGGIPMDIVNRVFEPYFTTKHDKGTGVGLYMSKNIIEKIGGNISVQNIENGAEFRIEINECEEGYF